MNILKRSPDSPSLLIVLAVVLVIIAMSAFAGMLAASASPLRVALGGAVIVGGFLLLAPRANLWLAIVLGLTTGVVFSVLGPGAAKMQWGIVLLALMLFLPVLLNFLPRPRLPAFMWMYMAFIVLSIIMTMIEWPGANQMAAGMKRYYQTLGIMLALVVIPFTRSDDLLLRKTFFWIGLLQLPFVLWEAFVLVPIRAASKASRAAEYSSEVTDVIAGTFGANLAGGSPGPEMVAFVLILMAFAWGRWRQGLLSGKKLAWFVGLLLPCVTLGEVKIVVVMFPLLALVMYKSDIAANPGRYLPVMMAAGLCTAAFTYLYFGYFSGQDVSVGFERMLRYNVEDQGHGQLILNRTTALTFWWERQGMHDPVGFLFGHGLGSSYWTPDPTVPSGFIGGKYPYYGVGLTALSTLLWDAGFLGTLLFIGSFIVAGIQSHRLYRREADPEIRSRVLGIQAALVIFMVYTPYNPSIISILPFQIIVAVVLGYLGRMLLNPEIFRSQNAAHPK